MSNIVLNPKTEAVTKELQVIINKWHDYIRSIDTDTRIVRDDYGEIVALVPRIHVVFKDESDFIHELATDGKTNVH